MLFFFISFAAGVLTVLAPCILPLLPVIIGSSVQGGSNKKAFTVIGSLVVSIVLFTLLIKVSSVFLSVGPDIWKYISAAILGILALAYIFPGLWESIPFMGKLSIQSNKALGAGFQKKSFWGDVLTGAALGPVFSTCSPTYFVILATVLPSSFALGLVYLSAYALGLGSILLAISLFGQKVADKLTKAADPHGIFKKVIGVLFLLVALGIITGYDKKIQIKVLDAGFFDVTKVEQKLLEKVDLIKEDNSNSVSEIPGTQTKTDKMPIPESKNTIVPEMSDQQKEIEVTKKPEKKNMTKLASQGKFTEIVDASGYLNTNGQKIQIGDYVGKKIILVEILTYSCINCQRTVPYLNDWYTKYKDKGLIVIAIHAPEFAYEKNIDNVQKELVQKQGVRFPVVLDNDFKTWSAYKNQFWPHRYLIDLNGDVVDDHIGEGKYAETEQKIVQLLETLPQQ